MYCNYLKITALAAVLLAVGCSEAPKANTSAKESSGATDPISAKTAFWAMYKSAHSWAPDLMPLTVESKQVPGMKNDGGKAAMWSATFASPSKREARVFSYAVTSHAPEIYKGVTVGRSLPWSGPTSEAMPFTTEQFAVDSDAAYTAAQTQAAAWVKKHPDKQASLALGNAARFSGPVWRVVWGDAKSGYGVFVDAKTGAVVKK